MVDLREGLTSGVREAVCTVLTPAGNASRYFGELAEQVPVVGGVLAFPSNLFANAAGLACDAPPTPGQLDPALPPIDGQCPVIYDLTATVKFTYTDDIDRPAITRTSALIGPISSPVVEIDEDNPAFPNARVRWFGGVEGSGTTISGGSGAETAVVLSQSTVRQDGLPDDCGDENAPPPVLPPGDRTPRITIDFGDGLIDIDFRVNSPEINLNGDIIIPVSIFGPNFNFDASFNLSLGGISFNFGGGGEGDGCCPAEDDEDSSEKLILGVTINQLSIVQGRYVSQIPNTQEPKVYGPYLGLIRFSRKKGGETYYTSDIRVKTSPQDIPCPWPRGATGIVVDKQLGVDFEVSPYYAKIRSQPSTEE